MVIHYNSTYSSVYGDHMDKKSSTPGKPPWNGFNLPRPHLLRRWNTLPLYQRGVSGQGESVSSSKIYQSVGNIAPLHRPPISWARQQGILTATPTLPLPVRQMTVGALQARSGPEQTRMDPSFYGDNLPSTQSLSEHSLTGELGSFDASVFASSPNSLYMYELEKADMQSSYGNVPICSSTSTLFFADDFDLKDKYETSQDIPPVSDASLSEVTSVLTQSLAGTEDSQTNLKLQLSKSDDVFEDPTLAELNFSPLLDDIANLASMSSSGEVLGQRSNSTGQKCSFDQDMKSWALLQQCGMKTEPQSKSPCSLSSAWPVGRMASPLTTTTWSVRGMMSPATTDSYMNRRTVSTSSVDIKPSIPVRQISETVSSSADVKPELAPLSEIHNIIGVNKGSNQVIKSFIENKTAPSPPRVLPTTPATSALGKRRSPQSTVTFNEIDQKWEEIRQFIHDDEPDLAPKPKIKRESLDSISSFVSVDDDDSDSDISSEDDWNSDSDSDTNQDTSWTSTKRKDSSSKKDQYFWQYNIQSKGPKGTRMNFDLSSKNPHVLQDFEDPVFDVEKGKKLGLGTSIRHGGKARKGDGNNVAPNAKKLGQIGSQLKKINKQINTFAPLCDMPVSTRNKSKKEKNKLASRACRLKKKAQHEAYKVKLYGLELEHRQLMTVMEEIKNQVHDVIDKKAPDGGLRSHLDTLIKTHLTVMVAGHTTDYVNSVVKKVEDGDSTGGLGT